MENVIIDNIYDIQIDSKDYFNYLNFTKNKIFKILCLYEENEDWKKAVNTILLELVGAYKFFNNKTIFFIIMTKLKGLEEKEVNLKFFRKTIFEILNLLDKEVENELLRLV